MPAAKSTNKPLSALRLKNLGRQQNLWVDFRTCELARTYPTGNDAVGDR